MERSDELPEGTETKSEEEVKDHMNQDALPQVRNRIGDESAIQIEERCQLVVSKAFERAKDAPWPKSGW
jgi:TPP-dependent pyruvate/acetoin dehydrogenase alpha subunit